MEEELKLESGDEPGLKSGDEPRGGTPDSSGLEESLACVIQSSMDLPKKDWSQYPPLALAWIGDTVYDLIVRSILLGRGTTNPDRLHQKASGIVNARAQAALMRRIRDLLTDQEQSVCRRGRNAKPAHKAKNADMSDYLEATAFECLVGFLYQTGQYGRILELIGDEFTRETL